MELVHKVNIYMYVGLILQKEINLATFICVDKNEFDMHLLLYNNLIGQYVANVHACTISFNIRVFYIVVCIRLTVEFIKMRVCADTKRMGRRGANYVTY